MCLVLTYTLSFFNSFYTIRSSFCNFKLVRSKDFAAATYFIIGISVMEEK